MYSTAGLAAVDMGCTPYPWLKTMMTSSNENICCVIGHRWIPGPITQSFDVSLICAWINGWVNNREAGDLRRQYAYCDVTVMSSCAYVVGTGDGNVQYIPRNMHTVFALLCFVVVIHWLIYPYPSGLLHLHCGKLAIAPVPAKQPWWIWINTSREFIMNDCITTTKQLESTTKPCAYFLWYTVCAMVAANVVRTISDAGNEGKVNGKHQEYVYDL